MDKKVFSGGQYSAYAPWSQSKKGCVYCLTRLLQEKSGEQLDERGRTYCRHIIKTYEQMMVLREDIKEKDRRKFSSVFRETGVLKGYPDPLWGRPL